MRLRFVFPCLCAMGLALTARAEIGVCGFYHDVYQSEIKAKIQAGVPFELMSAVFADGHLVEKKAIRVSYNLWDEIVTLKSGEQTVTHFPIAQGVTQLCKYLEVGETLSPGRKYFFRLLLNPLWSERMVRLQVASQGPEIGGKVVGVNWQKLGSEMPSDKVLIEREILR